MSLIGEFTALAHDLFDAFEAVEATITRTTTTRTSADRAQGKLGTTVTETIVGRGRLGSRKVRSEDGTYRRQSIAKLDVAPVPGDLLTIGVATFEVIEVETINPHGAATGITFTAVLK